MGVGCVAAWSGCFTRLLLSYSCSMLAAFLLAAPKYDKVTRTKARVLQVAKKLQSMAK
jgi:hypothetical protein